MGISYMSLEIVVKRISNSAGRYPRKVCCAVSFISHRKEREWGEKNAGLRRVEEGWGYGRLALLREGDNGIAAAPLAAGNGVSPGAAIVRHKHLVAAWVVSAAGATIQRDAAHALRLSHVNLEPDPGTLWLSGRPARGEHTIKRV